MFTVNQILELLFSTSNVFRRGINNKRIIRHIWFGGESSCVFATSTFIHCTMYIHHSNGPSIQPTCQGKQNIFLQLLIWQLTSTGLYVMVTLCQSQFVESQQALDATQLPLRLELECRKFYSNSSCHCVQYQLFLRVSTIYCDSDLVNFRTIHRQPPFY